MRTVKATVKATVNDALIAIEETYPTFLEQEGLADTAENRLSFYDEALKQIQNGRDELPPVVYDVLWDELRAIRNRQHSRVIRNLRNNALKR